MPLIVQKTLKEFRNPIVFETKTPSRQYQTKRKKNQNFRATTNRFEVLRHVRNSFLLAVNIRKHVAEYLYQTTI